ncbi:MAG: cation-transporting P-type ATPase [Desulfobacterales bacterium]|nr:cation-transporting P-type ATPase [Desulfobacterales bacterium]
METLISRHWHAIPAADVGRFLDSDLDIGLDQFEVRRRQEHFGLNIITPKKRKNLLLLFLQQFHQPLVYILIAAALVTLIMQEWVESSFIIGVILINAVISFLQESKAVAAIEALAQSMETETTVIRSGKQERVNAAVLIPGDIVLLQSGDKVPADVRLIEVRTLRVDESTLTGESVPVDKQSDALESGLPLADRINMAYASTLVTNGRATGIVTATGDKTEVGRISQLISSATELQTPLTRKIGQFSRYLLVVILILAALTFFVGLWRGEPLIDMFLAAVALAVGAIPEGMPAAITIMLAMGVSRMAKRQAIIRKLPAVETLGSTTVICSDKTGTLTRNEMTVQKIYTPQGSFAVDGSGYSPSGKITPIEAKDSATDSLAMRECLICGVLCNDSRLLHQEDRWEINGDPTEAALIAAAAKAGIDADRLRADYPRKDEIPFDSDRQYMATLHLNPDTGQRYVYLKGAVETVIERCTSALSINGESLDLDHSSVSSAAADLAAEGLRVLAFAKSKPLQSDQEIDQVHDRKDLIFLGLQAMMDPPRDNSHQAVAICHQAGIKVKMITGDHALTAETIAKQIGIVDQSEEDHRTVFQGREMTAMNDEELIEVAQNAAVFARVSPEQKLRLVEALQEKSNVVAMTGDGVNDAPALRKANIGVAMGDKGTEVAKEAADMVLLDDNFATIVAAVEEGRSVFDNLIKFIVWTLPTNLGEGLVILAAVFAGVTLPILPIQILWINMSTAVLLGLMLAFEPRESDIMERAPRDPTLPMLTGEMIFRIFFVGFLMLVGGFGLFEWAELRGVEIDRARTIAVNVFIFIEIFYLFNSRSLSNSVFRIGLFTNPWAFAGVAVMIVLQILYTYLPQANRIFQSAPIGWFDWLKILLFASLVFVLVEFEKGLRRRRTRKKS